MGDSGDVRAYAAALYRPALVLGQTAPDTGVLTGLEGPHEALVSHRATAADRLGLVDLKQGGASVADGEEELRILVTAGCFVTPVHAGLTLCVFRVPGKS